MFETIVTKIIADLGPTGLLIVGLYFYLARPLEQIVKQLEIINKDTLPSKDVIIDCTEKICEHINGKD